MHVIFNEPNPFDPKREKDVGVDVIFYRLNLNEDLEDTILDFGKKKRSSSDD